MHGTIFKEVYFYPLAILLFLLDVCCFSFMEKQLIYMLLCLFCVQLYSEKSVSRLSFLAVLISLESLLYFGKFGVQLLYLIPIFFISHEAKKNLHAVALQSYIILISCIALQSFILEPYMLQIGPSALYTFSKIIANIIVLWLISLIDSSQGSLSNRFNPFRWFREESPDS